MRKEVIDIDVRGLDDATKDVDELNKSIEKLDTSIESVGSEAAATGTDMEKGFDKGAGGAKRLAIGIKGIGIAIKAAGIGLLIAAFAQFQELFAGDVITDTLTTAAETLNNIFRGQGLADAFKNAQATVALRKRLEIAEKQFQITQLKGQKIAEEERQIRDDVSRSISERIEANVKLGLLLQEQLDSELKLANANESFLASEHEKLGTQASLLALKDAEIKVLEIEERLVSQASEQKVNAVALQKELNQLIITETELSKGQLIFRSTRDIHELRLIESRQRALEQEFARQNAILQFTIENEEAGTQALADALVERENLSQDHQKASIALADAEFKAKKGLVTDLSNTIIDVFGKTSTVGKALAIANAIWNVHEGITKALTLAPPWSFIAAAATAVRGFAAVRSIVATPNPAGSDTSAGITTTVPQVQAPQFNIVGATDVNQLATSISQQTQTPIKAFVVAKDVTTQQELDRNTVSTATFGT